MRGEADSTEKSEVSASPSGEGRMEELDMYEEVDFDCETQQRLDVEVDRLLKGYDWTLSPLANK